MISKQRAIDAIRDFQAQITCSFSEMWLNGMNEGFDHAVGVIELMETVDAVPVIRCRHCKYCDCDTAYGVIIPGTEFCTLTRDECISADDFCSRGEAYDRKID